MEYVIVSLITLAFTLAGLLLVVRFGERQDCKFLDPEPEDRKPRSEAR